MIEAWLSSSLTIRSRSPVMVGITPLLAVNPDWKRQHRLGVLEGRQPPLELLVQLHGAGDGPHRAAADAQVTDRGQRGLAPDGDGWPGPGSCWTRG